jgi:hypothetical protein
MTICAYCGFAVANAQALCPLHHRGAVTGWAEANRLMCDLLHRGKPPATDQPRAAPEAACCRSWADEPAGAGEPPGRLAAGRIPPAAA